MQEYLHKTMKCTQRKLFLSITAVACICVIVLLDTITQPSPWYRTKAAGNSNSFKPVCITKLAGWDKTELAKVPNSGIPFKPAYDGTTTLKDESTGDLNSEIPDNDATTRSPSWLKTESTGDLNSEIPFKPDNDATTRSPSWLKTESTGDLNSEIPFKPDNDATTRSTALLKKESIIPRKGSDVKGEESKKPVSTPDHQPARPKPMPRAPPRQKPAQPHKPTTRPMASLKKKPRRQKPAQPHKPTTRPMASLKKKPRRQKPALPHKPATRSMASLKKEPPRQKPALPHKPATRQVASLKKELTGDFNSGIPFKPICDLWVDTLHRKSSMHSSPNLKGYILVLFVAQQTQSALIEFYALARIAASLRLQIVEPMLTNGRFQVPPSLQLYQRDVLLLRFSDLYNLTASNSYIGECLGIDYPIIAPLEDFVSAASSSEAIVVNLMKQQIDQWCTKENETQEHIKSITEMISHLFAQVPAAKSETRNQPHPEISKVDCVDAQETVNLTKVFSTAVSSGNDFTNSTTNVIVVPHWIGIQSPPNWFQTYYHDPDYVRKDCPYMKSLPHSEAVLIAAKKMLSYLNLSMPRIGIHMRIEKLVLQQYSEEAIKQCTDRAITALETLRVQYGLDLHNAVFIRDYSSMGTDSCGLCTKLANTTAFDERLINLGVHILEYHEKFRCTTGDRAFISFLEKEVVSQADYLLTVGSGAYTSSLIQRFRAKFDNDPKERMFHICISKQDDLHLDHMP